MAIMRRDRNEALEAATVSFLAEVATPGASSRLKDYGMQRVWARAEAYHEAKAPAAAKRVYRNPALLRHVLVIGLVVLMVLLVSSTGAYAFSYNTQPDSPLYGAKIFFERARVTLTPSSVEDIRLEMSYSERRMEELQSMVASGNQEGSDRWLREYRRNVEGAGVLFEAISTQETEQLSLQFQEMLDQQEHMMQGMRHGQPSGLSGSIDGAYQVCDQERMRMRRRCGQETPGDPSQQPGEPQRKGNRPETEGSSMQAEPPSSSGARPVDDSAPTGGAYTPTDPSQTTGSPANGTTGSTVIETGSPVNESASSMNESGQDLEGMGYQGDSPHRGYLP